MNIERHMAIIALIKADPKCWEQNVWHCGTKHCYAGLAQIASGKPERSSTVRVEARLWLDLTLAEADYLFDGRRTLAELERCEVPESWVANAACELNSRDGYDPDGLDINNRLRPDAHYNLKAFEDNDPDLETPF